MGEPSDRIDPKLRKWIERQSLFFVGTAPLSKTGHVNVSPKGPIGSLRVLDPKTIAYLDVVGSGAETIAHVRENGRVVVMLCAFDGAPRIVRLHGRGEILLPSTKRYRELLARAGFDDGYIPEARRAIVLVHLARVADSCGYGVPLMRFEGERTQMNAWGKKKLAKNGPEALVAYQRDKNAESLDGLPAVDLKSAGRVSRTGSRGAPARSSRAPKRGARR
jgi:hypothetical protein